MHKRIIETLIFACGASIDVYMKNTAERFPLSAVFI